MATPLKGISIVVCCYNSAKRLKPTLLHLSRQVVNEQTKLEVVIIDNVSNDDTVQVAEHYWRSLRCKFPFRIVNEYEPGLSHARKRGVFEARHALILFCDDDNWLDEHYVQSAFDIMLGDSSIGILGGCGFPEYEVTPPVWFQKYRKSYALGPQTGQDGYLLRSENIYGAGMVVRRDVLWLLYSSGFSSVLSDRKGETLSTGGDTEICIWFKRLGYRLYYSGTIKFKHFIPKERLTESYFLNRSYEKGKTEAIFLLYNAMLDGMNVKWIDQWYLWYWEIFKRLVHYSLSLRYFDSFDSRVKRKILISSIKLRATNSVYLKKTNDSIMSLSQTLSKSE